jgi:hemolysin activation/secretion protein
VYQLVRSLRNILGAFLLLSLCDSDVLPAQPSLPTLEQLPIVERPHAGPFEVRTFQFTNNTAFSSEELSQITRDYVGRRIEATELEAARIAVTSNYVARGYINSGAIIDHPPNADGVVLLRVIEGQLTDVHVRSNRWNGSRFYENRIGLRSPKPLNVNELRDRLQVWRRVYPIEQLNAELRPGIHPGEAQLDLTVKEQWPYHLGVQYANDRPPSTGSEQITAIAEIDTLTGHNDPFTFNYVIARGGSPGFQDPELLGVDDLSVAYRYPVSASDTTIGGRYIRSSAAIVEDAFRELDITAQSELFGISISQPVWRTPGKDLSLDLIAEHKSNSSYLLGVPYSFSPGAVDGETRLTALRIAGQFVTRSQRQVVATRLTLSTGLNALDATQNDRGPDWQFFSLLGQAQYIRRVGSTDHQWVSRVTGQYSPDPLLSLEQLIIGGASTVRGYRESSLLRDTGILASLEFRLALWPRREGNPYLQLVPFADIGAGWNNDRPTPDPDTISSVGIGAVITPLKQIEMSVFWGHALRVIENPGYDPQDDGIHFAIRVWAF